VAKNCFATEFAKNLHINNSADLPPPPPPTERIHMKGESIMCVGLYVGLAINKKLRRPAGKVKGR
jgi:hypothetical protein